MLMWSSGSGNPITDARVSWCKFRDNINFVVESHFLHLCMHTYMDVIIKIE